MQAEAGTRVIALYDAWGKKDKADEWRRKFDTRKKTLSPADLLAAGKTGSWRRSPAIPIALPGARRRPGRPGWDRAGAIPVAADGPIVGAGDSDVTRSIGSTDRFRISDSGDQVQGAISDDERRRPGTGDEGFADLSKA